LKFLISNRHCLSDCLSNCLSDYTPIKFSGPIIKTLAYNHTQDNHSDNISGIRAIEIVNVFEMEFRWEKGYKLVFKHNFYIDNNALVSLNTSALVKTLAISF
jgi:hypothetical protein